MIRSDPHVLVKEQRVALSETDLAATMCVHDQPVTRQRAAACRQTEHTCWSCVYQTADDPGDQGGPGQFGVDDHHFHGSPLKTSHC